MKRKGRSTSRQTSYNSSEIWNKGSCL